MGMGLTPLHSAIYGYHASRVDETCEFIDELLNAGADAQIVNKVWSVLCKYIIYIYIYIIQYPITLVRIMIILLVFM